MIIQMDNGAVVNTDKATARWNEDTWWDGHNNISKATGSQWEHETLYKSSKGRYYILSQSNVQGTPTTAEWQTGEAAARWLLTNGHDLPDDLEAQREAIEE